MHACGPQQNFETKHDYTHRHRIFVFKPVFEQRYKISIFVPEGAYKGHIMVMNNKNTLFSSFCLRVLSTVLHQRHFHKK